MGHSFRPIFLYIPCNNIFEPKSLVKGVITNYPMGDDHRILYIYSMRRCRIWRFIQSSHVISDEAQPSRILSWRDWINLHIRNAESNKYFIFHDNLLVHHSQSKLAENILKQTHYNIQKTLLISPLIVVISNHVFKSN